MVVCTANICRSVMAERFLRRDAAAREIALEISSSGFCSTMNRRPTR
jgi:protein-tyrosine-phosphatase